MTRDVRRWRRRPTRVRTPTVLQMEASECGAAALAIVLAYHGCWVPLEELRHECGVSRDGSKAVNLLRAARKFGLDANGHKCNELGKLRELPLPAVLFWNFNHFVVLEGFARERVFVNDPAEGPRTVTAAELDGAFSGVALTFRPSANFNTRGAAPRLLPALRARLTGLRAALFYVILCGTLLLIPGVAVPTFTRMFVDDVLGARQEWLLRQLLLAMLAAVLIQGALTFLQKQALLRLETALALSTSSAFLQHVLRLPVAYFQQRYIGEIGSRVLINDKVAKVISARLAGTIVDCVMGLGYAALMAMYDPVLTLVVIAIALLDVAAIGLAARSRADRSRRLMQSQGRLMGVGMNGLQMIETIKATASDGEFFERWAGYYAATINARQDLQGLGYRFAAVPIVVQSLSTAVVLFFGGRQVMNGNLTIGMLVAYQALLSGLTRPLTTFVEFGSTLQELEADMSRLDDVLRSPADAQYARPHTEQPAAKLKLDGALELRDVTFGFSPLNPPLVEGFSLKIEPGRRVAIVGATGSGKSTVAKLVAGFYEPWGGEILFDGVPRALLPGALLANSVAMVDQERFLFGGSVADNVTMWNGSVDARRVARACHDAGIGRHD